MDDAIRTLQILLTLTLLSSACADPPLAAPRISKRRRVSEQPTEAAVPAIRLPWLERDLEAIGVHAAVLEEPSQRSAGSTQGCVLVHTCTRAPDVCVTVSRGVECTLDAWNGPRAAGPTVMFLGAQVQTTMAHRRQAGAEGGFAGPDGHLSFRQIAPTDRALTVAVHCVADDCVRAVFACEASALPSLEAERSRFFAAVERR